MKKKEIDQINIEGNLGANFVNIIKLDDNRMHLTIGDCCVITVDVIFTAEVFSNFLTTLSLEANKDLLEVAASKMRWDDDTNKKFLKGCQ